MYDISYVQDFKVFLFGQNFGGKMVLVSTKRTKSFFETISSFLAYLWPFISPSASPIIALSSDTTCKLASKTLSFRVARFLLVQYTKTGKNIQNDH
jgi:hypothetical protein